MNTPDAIHYSDGRKVFNPVVQIWDDWHTERSGHYRAFWCESPNATTGSPVIGYCSPGGSHRTVRATAREVWRHYPDAPIYRNGLPLGPFIVPYRGRRRPFATLQAAADYCAEIFNRSNIVAAITRVIA